MTTFRSKLFALVILLALSVTGLAQAQDAKYAPERMALAKKYIETIGLEADIKTAVSTMASSVPAENRVLYRRLAETGIDYDRLRAAAELAVLDVFTDTEIKAMNDFYSTPEGQAIRGKMANYDKRMQPIINDTLTEFVKKLQENKVIPE